MPELNKSFFEKIAKDIDRGVTEIENDALIRFRKVFENYKARFEAAISRADFSSDTITRLAEAQQLNNDLFNYLEDAGFKEFAAEFQTRHAAVADLSMQYFERIEAPATLSGASQQALNILAKDNTDRLIEVTEAKLVKPLRDSLTELTFSTSDFQTIQNQIFNISDGLRTDQVETLVTDTFQRFQRATREEHSKEVGLNEYLVWTGPLDGKTSAQCEYLLTRGRGPGNVWFVSEFTGDLHPQLPSNPRIAGGHWGCRHSTFPIDEARAKAMGVDVG